MSKADLIARMEEEAAFRESIVRAQAETITARFRVGDLTREIARLSAELKERDAMCERARKEEREACAKIAEEHMAGWSKQAIPEEYGNGLRNAAHIIAAAIRARTGKGDDNGAA